MAQGTIFQLPIDRTWNQDGTRSGGAKLSVQLAGTSTATSLFLDVGLTLPCATPASPLVADVNGVFPEIFATPGVAYKVTLTDTNGVALPGYPADNVLAVPASSSVVDTTETAGEAISAGQAVYLSRGDGVLNPGQLYRADTGNGYSSTGAYLGVAPNAIASGASGTFRTQGQVGGFVGLTAGANYYVSTLGTITSIPPTLARFVGRADSTTSLQVSPNPSPLMNFPGGGSIWPGGRLTVNFSSGPVVDGVTSTIGYTPYVSDVVELYDGAVWTPVTFGNLSLAVPNTTNQLYDIFLVLSAGAPALAAVAWTNDSTRATGITRVNGKLVLSSDTTRRYIGSMRTNATAGQVPDNFTQRFLWNYYNRVPRVLGRFETAANWLYNANTIRQANNNPLNQVAVILGLPEVVVDLSLTASGFCDTNGAGFGLGIGTDTTTGFTYEQAVNYATGNTSTIPSPQRLSTTPAAGYHFFSWNEQGAGVGNTTFYGASVGTSGLQGTIDG